MVGLGCPKTQHYTLTSASELLINLSLNTIQTWVENFIITRVMAIKSPKKISLKCRNNLPLQTIPLIKSNSFYKRTF